MPVQTSTICVARCKSTGQYVCIDDRFIRNTPYLGAAYNFGNASGIMRKMGGHYHGHEAVMVTVTREVGEVVPFPPESEVWPDDDAAQVGGVI